MLWIATINGIPVARAGSLGLMGRKLARIRGQIAKGLTIKGIFPDAEWVRKFADDPEVRSILVYCMDGDVVVNMIAYAI